MSYKSKKNQDRVETVKAMHKIVCRLNNENAYFSWINIVPDEPEEDDFEFIGNDDELFESAVISFKNIMVKYLKDGIYMPVEGSLY